ncbi:hypothetical protein QWY85_16180 [Neolewinella lacunae]|uniref:Uncharacterized protein n=1 Tax=Neolewinella lacunae TaxID=1517758 RepID=A0A923PN09_9BACT|nr:hypothetical protein [Neolewinella lacunae]MBC6993517.1 hypothetical protein [Neolewinella lacunae]MDN3636207.1 hypothetical protein [Neolewinella lacunae]
MKVSELPLFFDQLQEARQVLTTSSIREAIQGEIDEFADERNVYLDADSGWPEELKRNFLILLQDVEGIEVLEKWRGELLAGKPRVAPGTLDLFIQEFLHHFDRFGTEKIDVVCLMYDEMPQMHIDLWQFDTDDPETDYGIYLKGKELTKYGDIGPLDLQPFGFFDYSIEDDFPALNFFDGYFSYMMWLREMNILLQITEAIAAVVPKDGVTLIVGKYNEGLSRFR